MQAERIPTREEILARRARLGLPVSPKSAVVDRELVSASQEMDAVKRDMTRHIIKAAAALDMAIDNYKLATGVAYPLARLAPHISGSRIVHEEAKRAGISAAQLCGAKRTAKIIRARHRAIWRMSKTLGLSSVVIGHIVGNRDHATILSSFKKVARMIERGQMEDPASADAADAEEPQ